MDSDGTGNRGEVMKRSVSIGLVVAALATISCAHSAKLSVGDGTGPRPKLPSPSTSLIPTVKIAEAERWNAGESPVAASGLRVTRLADGLDHPRWVYVLPNGDVLVAETNAPVRPVENKGLRAKIMGIFMKKAGAATPSANRLTLLRDADGDGIAEMRSTFADNLNSPFGISLIGSSLYVANTDAVVRLAYAPGATRASGNPETVLPLPAGPRNHHWTKNIIASPDGSKLYVSIGSNSNAAENGLAEETGRASIWEFDVATGTHRTYATGMRNPVGMTWIGDVLWVAVNERDELGSDLVPDYMTAVRDGGFYGWPFSYYGQNVDTRVKPQDAALVARAIVPDYGLGPHTASLGLTNASGSTLGTAFAQGVFVGQHGSWNRSPRSGYKVIFVPFNGATPAGQPIDVLTGFLQDGKARGRPVGVAIDSRGGLLVADDVGNIVWRVTRAQ